MRSARPCHRRIQTAAVQSSTCTATCRREASSHPTKMPRAEGSAGHRRGERFPLRAYLTKGSKVAVSLSMIWAFFGTAGVALLDRGGLHDRRARAPIRRRQHQQFNPAIAGLAFSCVRRDRVLIGIAEHANPRGHHVVAHEFSAHGDGAVRREIPVVLVAGSLRRILYDRRVVGVPGYEQFEVPHLRHVQDLGKSADDRLRLRVELRCPWRMYALCRM